MAHIKENWTRKAGSTEKVPIDGMTDPPTLETSVRTTGTAWEPFFGAMGKATRAITSRTREPAKAFTVGRTAPHTGALSSMGRDTERELSSIPTVASTKENGSTICNTGKARSPGPMGQPWRESGGAANWSPPHPIFRSGLPSQQFGRVGKRERNPMKTQWSPLSFHTDISPNRKKRLGQPLAQNLPSQSPLPKIRPTKRLLFLNQAQALPPHQHQHHHQPQPPHQHQHLNNPHPFSPLKIQWSPNRRPKIRQQPSKARIMIQTCGRETGWKRSCNS